MGYHKREIVRGVLGYVSKVREELEELEDALEQKAYIMAMLEMSDLYGALEALADKWELTMDDLRIMSDLTKSAFYDGSRKSSDTLPEREFH